MANYPSAAPSFTTKTAGQTIAAAHVNDLQDEVAAIGGDLVNGTLQHDLIPQTNSTRSLGSASNRWRTIHGTTGAFNRLESTSLSVAGESTLSTLTLTGNLASTGVIGSSASRVRELWVGQLDASSQSAGGQVAARVTLNAAAALTNNTTLAVAWDVQQGISNSSLHSTGTNPQRLIPVDTGFYCVAAVIALSTALSAATSGAVNVSITDSTGDAIAEVQARTDVSGQTGMFTNVAITTLKHFDSTAGSTQYCRVEVRVRDASTHSVSTRSHVSFFKV